MKNRYITLLLGLIPLTSCGTSNSTVSIVEEWGKATYTWSNDYATCTAKRVWSTDLNRIETETVNSSYEIVTNATCVDNGLGRYIADFENPDFVTQTYECEIPARGHDYQFDSFVWNEYTAKAKYICSRDASHVALYDAVMSNEITTSPTCLNSGLKVHTATYKEHTDTKTEVLEPLDHDWDEPTYEQIDDDEMKATIVCKRDANHKVEETVTGVYSVITPATEEAEGLGKYTYTFESELFTTQTVEKVIHKLPYGSYPHMGSEDRTLIFGVYPQTRVSDEELCEALNFEAERAENGWYYYEGEYYTNARATPYGTGSSYCFDDKKAIGMYQYYWFKVEPIVWHIAQNRGSTFILLSKKLLEPRKYAVNNRNNYEDSSIRDWLNDEFYKSAFYFNEEPIQVTEVDNSARSTGSDSNRFACDNTSDKVFLFSYMDYINPGYGFNEPADREGRTRYCRTTDYARALGACVGSVGTSFPNGLYWTRSPNSGNDHYAFYVRQDGVIHYDNNVSYSYLCARPAITIEFEQQQN